MSSELASIPWHIDLSRVSVCGGVRSWWVGCDYVPLKDESHVRSESHIVVSPPLEAGRADILEPGARFHNDVHKREGVPVLPAACGFFQRSRPPRTPAGSAVESQEANQACPGAGCSSPTCLAASAKHFCPA